MYVYFKQCTVPVALVLLKDRDTACLHTNMLGRRRTLENLLGQTIPSKRHLSYKLELHSLHGLTRFREHDHGLGQAPPGHPLKTDAD